MDSSSTATSSRTARRSRTICAELLRIPSVSADSRQRADVRRAAEWVAAQFQRAGPGDGADRDGRPSARLRRVAAGARQAGRAGLRPLRRAAARPARRMDHARRSSRRVRDGNLYARGATDDKGQMLTHVKSVEAWLEDGRQAAAASEVPDRRRRGSRQRAPRAVRRSAIASKLACDCVVISDCSQFAPGMPAITYGLRGIAYYELRLHGPQAGSALRHVRRRGDQPGQRAGRSCWPR